MGHRMLDGNDPRAKNIPQEDPLGPVVYDTMQECVIDLAKAKRELGIKGPAIPSMDYSGWVACQVHLDQKTNPADQTPAATVTPGGIDFTPDRKKE